MNLCSVDLCKAFDKINHFALFLKLLKRGLPKQFIAILICWYSKLSSRVKWGDSFSKRIFLTSGVRQGGVLSPFLFNVLVDDVLDVLGTTKRGCYMKWICMNSFMYADDLIILAISLSDLEYLLNLCVGVFKTLGMEINTKKTSCIRIGPRHNVSISNVFLNGQILLWNQELNYLGIVLCSAKKFTVNQQKCKQKFFKSINGFLVRSASIPLYQFYHH